jgi:hypothetical protein
MLVERIEGFTTYCGGRSTWEAYSVSSQLQLSSHIQAEGLEMQMTTRYDLPYGCCILSGKCATTGLQTFLRTVSESRKSTITNP